MRTLLLGISLAAAVCASAAVRATAAAPGTLAIRHVSVVDVTGGPTRADQTVLVQGNRIVAVGPAAGVRVPAGARVVDGSGKYLIPGLWDMHTHITYAHAGLSLMLANGVTGIRDMGAQRFATAKGWRDSIAAGQMLGPRMRIASPVVENARWLANVRRIPVYEPLLRERFGPTSPEEAVRWVDSVKALGADHVKVRNWPAPEIAFALVTRAKERGLPVVAHANRPFPPRDVASYEHGIFPALAVSDSERATLFRGFAARGVAFVPTTVTWEGRLLPNDSLVARFDRARTPAYRYVPAAMLQQWREEIEARKFETPFDYPPLFAADLRNFREMRALGIPLLTGADAPSIGLVPGFSLHDELGRFVSVIGATPLEALQAATLAPARFMGMADSVGSVQVGKVADLVLLDADPLADIGNTRRIRAVIANGRLLDRAALDALLAEVERAPDR
ncbi:MAG TPA: amidohydrolase family protein [Longimicrobium sp.]|nr:amidohydrolase family protein [Longimicrobium sp.]